MLPYHPNPDPVRSSGRAAACCTVTQCTQAVTAARRPGSEAPSRGGRRSLSLAGPVRSDRTAVL
eukprot:195870-Hanusia_phi.AAC.1